MVKIVRAIVHEIPEGRYSPESDTQVRFSTTISDFAPETRRFIEDNMLDFALKSPRDVIEDPETSSNTPALATAILSDPDSSFVANSKELAKNLHQAQTGNSPSGIFVVAIVSDKDGEALLLMKAEHQEGMRLRRVGDEESGRFDLEHLDELIVGNNSRVYKIAILRKANERVLGQMVDQQNGVAFAEFFLTRFLGCRLADNAEVQTKQFMDATMNFINNDVEDEEKRGKYATALIAYMSSPAETFEANAFSQQFLEPEDRDSFQHALPESVSDKVIGKNLALVPGQGAGIRLYGAGVVISASSHAMSNGVVEIHEENGQTIVRVVGALRRYGLGAAPKS